MRSELIELEKAQISFWVYSWDPKGLEQGFVMWKIPSLPWTIEVSLIKYFSSLLILLRFPCVNSSVCGFPPRGHTSLAQHPVNTVPIPPWSFCLCQCLETLRVTLNHLIWTGCKSVQRCVDGQSIPIMIVFYVFIFLWDGTGNPYHLQLKSIWNVAQTFSTFHGTGRAPGHSRLFWVLEEADAWFEFGGVMPVFSRRPNK